MTEEQWLASDDPERMLASLQGRASERKLRLFLVGCARRVLTSSPDGDTVEALAVAERFADGAESPHRLARARAALKVSRRSRVHPEAPLDTGHISSVPAWHAAREEVGPAAVEGASCCAWSTSLGPSYGGPSSGLLSRRTSSRPRPRSCATSSVTRTARSASPPPGSCLRWSPSPGRPTSSGGCPPAPSTDASSPTWPRPSSRPAAGTPTS